MLEVFFITASVGFIISLFINYQQYKYMKVKSKWYEDTLEYYKLITESYDTYMQETLNANKTQN